MRKKMTGGEAGYNWAEVLQSKDTYTIDKHREWRGEHSSTEQEARWGSASIPVSSEMLPQLLIHQLLPLYRITVKFTGGSEPCRAPWSLGPRRLCNAYLFPYKYLIHSGWLQKEIYVLTHTYAWRCQVLHVVVIKAGSMKVIYLYVKQEH